MSSGPRVLVLGPAGQLGRELQQSFAGRRRSCDAKSGHTQSRGPGADARIHPQRRAGCHSQCRCLHGGGSRRIRAGASRWRSTRELRECWLKKPSAWAPCWCTIRRTMFSMDRRRARGTRTDSPKPLNVYGASKLAGEQAILRVGGRFLIFRTSWVYGPRGNNFLLTMLRLGRERDRLNIVDDQIGAPTTTIELAHATHSIVDGILSDRFGAIEKWAGIYHMTCGGSVSWCGFARAIYERGESLLRGRSPIVHPIGTSEYPTAAKRPQNSVLSNEKLRGCFGIELSPWDCALDVVVQRLKAEDRMA